MFAQSLGMRLLLLHSNFALILLGTPLCAGWINRAVLLPVMKACFTPSMTDHEVKTLLQSQSLKSVVSGHHKCKQTNKQTTIATTTTTTNNENKTTTPSGAVKSQGWGTNKQTNHKTKGKTNKQSVTRKENYNSFRSSKVDRAVEVIAYSKRIHV